MAIKHAVSFATCASLLLGACALNTDRTAPEIDSAEYALGPVDPLPGPDPDPDPNPDPEPPPPPPPASSPMTQTVTAVSVREYDVYFFANETITFTTTALSSGADPVLHLIGLDGKSQVLVNDNGAGGTAAKLTYKAPAAGWYKLILRARTPTSAGVCTLLRNSSVFRSSQSFGFGGVNLPTVRASESIETVEVARGPKVHVMYLLGSNGLDIAARAQGGGTGGGARYVAPLNLGTRTVVVGTLDTNAGIVRLVRNDAAMSGHDTDLDGLGNELEREMGTCASRTELATGPDGKMFACGVLADARDSDGDGIRDDWETLGRRDMLPHQLLPRWGADPRHKDLFIEIDFMRRCLSENQGNVLRYMPAATARHFAKIFADGFTTAQAAKDAHAATLYNPDGLPGIRVHFDTGKDPVTTAPDSDWTLYGNWGGYNAVAAVSTSDTNQCMASDGTYWKGQSANAVWQNQMSAARRGIFRYHLGFDEYSGSNGVGFGADYGWLSLTVGAHETGHTLGLGHSGGAGGYVDPNCKPNYPSIMSYAYQNETDVGFADGTTEYSAPPLNNAKLLERSVLSPAATKTFDLLERVFGYTVDRAAGHVDWNRDGLFAPAGTTVRAYANQTPGGWCEYTRYNSANVGGKATTSPALARLGARQYVFYQVGGKLKYRVTSGNWNCPVPAVDCNGSSFGPELDAGMDAWGVDAMRYRLNGEEQLLVVTIDAAGNLRERRLRLVNNAEVWSAVNVLTGAYAVNEPGLAEIDGGIAGYLVYKGSDLRYYTRYFSPAAGGFQTETQVLDASGTPLVATSKWASAALVQGYMPGSNSKSLYGFFPQGTDVARLSAYRLNLSTFRWDAVSSLEDTGPVYGRPAATWVQTGTSEMAGKLYLLFAAGGGKELLQMATYTRIFPNGARIDAVGMRSPHDNGWLGAWGVDADFRLGVDDNLRAVFSMDLGNPSTRYDLVYRPKADAIHDYTYANWNDWSTLRKNLCPLTANPAGTVSNPVTCN